MTARPMTEERADELLDAFEQAVSDRAEDGMSYRHHVDGPRDEARGALRAALLSTSAAVRGMREALERLIDEIVAGEEHGDGADDDECPICSAIKAGQAALSGIEPGEDEQATRAES